ncbi:MAG: hypothetical protein IT457_19405 [Planctomycetes bacterium]|nr:hypothetical protein [Planctomycetota bacterium]
MTCSPRRDRRVLSLAGALAASLALPAALTAQGYRDYRAPNFQDFGLVRARPTPWKTGFVVRGGLAGSLAADEDEALALENATAFDGFAWFRGDHLGDREAQLDLYAARDGVIASIRDGRPEETGGRLELSGRFFPKWREGFYRGDTYVPTGQYEGRDFGAYLGFAAPIADGMTAEIGPFWRRYEFERGDQTLATYTIPDDFDTFGGRAQFQHESLAFDREYGRPVDGFLLAIRVEYEHNGSDQPFGTALWTSSLPSAFWRGGGHLEWYFPQGDGSVWEWQLDASMSDESDRVHNFDASKPAGHLWVDTSIGYRLDFGAMALTPSGRGQFTRTVEESGSGASDKFWFGGGFHLDWRLGDNFSVIGDYSYLSNANRPTVAWDRDVGGEHQFFAGLELRFGTTGR